MYVVVGEAASGGEPASKVTGPQAGGEAIAIAGVVNQSTGYIPRLGTNRSRGVVVGTKNLNALRAQS